MIALPHLGASTKEAEENCAVMVAEQIREFLENGNIRHSVNCPEVVMPRGSQYRMGVDNANVFAWRDALYDDIMISEGVNIRALGEDAPTAEQERLRAAREIEKIQKLMDNNEANWTRFAMTNMYMLQEVEIGFLDSKIGIEDEVSDEMEGEFDEGTVRQVIEEIEKGDYKFSVTVSVNNSNQKRKQIELFQKQAALNSIASIVGPVPAVQKMAFDIAKTEYPNLQFSEKDFVPEALPEEEGALPGGGATGLPAPVEQIGISEQVAAANL